MIPQLEKSEGIEQANPVGVKPAVAVAAQRIFIDASPEFLLNLYKDKTSLQGDALAANYLGKWISVTGEVADISEIMGHYIIVILFVNRKMVSATFLTEFRDHISHITQGAKITVRGELHAIDTISVKIRQCELVS